MILRHVIVTGLDGLIVAVDQRIPRCRFEWNPTPSELFNERRCARVRWHLGPHRDSTGLEVTP